MKPVILCADDYAMNNAISNGICELVQAKKLSAVGCMTGSPLWPGEASHLKPLEKQIDVGLHFNLTHTFTDSMPALDVLLRKSLAGAIDLAWVEKQLNSQLDLFEQGWNARPDFVDGHQHVHIFPGIRKVVFKVLTQRYAQGQRPWMRNINPQLSGHDAIAKAIILRLLAVGFARSAHTAGVQLSGNFAGLYSLSAAADYPKFMTSWLNTLDAGSLIMCHPAKQNNSSSDEIAQTRWKEWQYLNSNEFTTLCQQAEITFARFRDCCHTAT